MFKMNQILKELKQFQRIVHNVSIARASHISFDINFPVHEKFDMKVFTSGNMCYLECMQWQQLMMDIVY